MLRTNRKARSGRPGSGRAMLAIGFAVLALPMWATAQRTSSVGDSPRPAIRAASDAVPTPGLIGACSRAVNELVELRSLSAAQADEIAKLESGIEAARATNALLTELNDTRRRETEALRGTVAAKDETIAAKNGAIAKQDELIRVLEKRKPSTWKRVGDLAIGIAAGILLR